MIEYRLNLNNVAKRMINSKKLDNPLGDLHSIQLCVVYPSTRPVFIQSNMYDDINKFLSFVFQNKLYLEIVKDEKYVLTKDEFINEILKFTIEHKIDIETVNSIKLLKVQNNLYTDKFNTLWCSVEV